MDLIAAIPEYKEPLQEFILYKLDEKERRNRYKNNDTLTVYLRNIIEFLHIFKGDVTNIKTKDTETYVDYLKFDAVNTKGDSLTINTINLKIASINVFLKYLEDKYDKRYKSVPKVYEAMQYNIKGDMITNSDVSRILRQARKANDIRAVTMIYVLCYTGLRVSEMLQLKVTDVDKRIIRITGKGNKMRKVFLPISLRKQLKIYMDHRETLTYGAKTDKLFIGERGPVNRQLVNATLKKYAGKARVKKDIVSPHKFRHLCASNLESIGLKQTIISQILGHRLNITERYTSITERELLKVVDTIEFDKFLD